MAYSSRANREARRSLVQKKTAILVHEGKSPEQAYAMANSMAKAGRLTKSGGYRRVKRGG